MYISIFTFIFPSKMRQFTTPQKLSANDQLYYDLVRNDSSMFSYVQSSLLYECLIWVLDMRYGRVDERTLIGDSYLESLVSRYSIYKITYFKCSVSSSPSHAPPFLFHSRIKNA